MSKGKQGQSTSRHSQTYLYFPPGFRIVAQGPVSHLSFAAAKALPLISVFTNISTGEGALPAVPLGRGHQEQDR